MNLKEIFVSLKERLKSNKDNYIEQNSWMGDTVTGFYTETTFDIEALYAEIDKFSAQFAEHSLSAQDEVLTDERIEEIYEKGYLRAKKEYAPGGMDLGKLTMHKRDGVWYFTCDDVRALAAAARSPAVAVESEPVLWVESENNIRDKGARYAINSLCHTVVYHLEKPETDNPVWPLYAATPSPSLAVREKSNADCSSEPANCPDNEGYGCACDPMNKAGSAKP